MPDKIGIPAQVIIQNMDGKDYNDKEFCDLVENLYKQYDYSWIYGYSQLTLKKNSEFSFKAAINNEPYEMPIKNSIEFEKIIQIKFFSRDKEATLLREDKDFDSNAKNTNSWKLYEWEKAEEELIYEQQVISHNIAKKGKFVSKKDKQIQTILTVAKVIKYDDEGNAYIAQTHLHDVMNKSLTYGMED